MFRNSFFYKTPQVTTSDFCNFATRKNYEIPVFFAVYFIYLLHIFTADITLMYYMSNFIYLIFSLNCPNLMVNPLNNDVSKESNLIIDRYFVDFENTDDPFICTHKIFTDICVNLRIFYPAK